MLFKNLTLNIQNNRCVVVNIKDLTNKKVSYNKWLLRSRLSTFCRISLVTGTFSWWDFWLFGNSYFLFWNFFGNFRHFKDISILISWRIASKHLSHLHRIKHFLRVGGCIHLHQMEDHYMYVPLAGGTWGFLRTTGGSFFSGTTSLGTLGTSKDISSF